MRTEKGTFHSCTLCGTFPGLSSGPATRSPQSHCRFQGLEPVGCHRTRTCTTCLPQETYRLLRCPCAVEPSCLEYLDCRSSGQDLPLVLRGETTSHNAFLPGISQAPSQLRGTAGLWGAGQGPWHHTGILESASGGIPQARKSAGSCLDLSASVGHSRTILAHTNSGSPLLREALHTETSKSSKGQYISPSAGDSDCFVFFPAAFNRLMMFVYEVKCT